MKHEELIKKINERIDSNNREVAIFCNLHFFDVILNNNKVLREIVASLKQSDNDYEKGLNDCWEFVKSFILLPSAGGMDAITFKNIFGHNFPSEMMRTHTYHEARNKVEVYEQKKKEEEAEKPVVGDVVECCSTVTRFKGILIGESNDKYEVLTTVDTLAQLLSKDNWKLIKTGKHVDIQGTLDEIKKE